MVLIGRAWPRGSDARSRCYASNAELVTVVDDELPDDPLADLDETRYALRRLGL